MARRLARWITLDRLLVPLGIVLGLFVLHGVEIWLYALIYWRTGMLGTLEQALYFSTSAYSTVGETGALLPEAWYARRARARSSSAQHEERGAA